MHRYCLFILIPSLVLQPLSSASGEVLRFTKPHPFVSSPIRQEGAAHQNSQHAGILATMGSSDDTIELPSKVASLGLKWVGLAQFKTRFMRGRNVRPGKRNYFLRACNAVVHRFPELRTSGVRSVYPGINLCLRHQRNFESDIVSAGAPSKRLKLCSPGHRIRVDAKWRLGAFDECGRITGKRRRVYQNIEGKKARVDGRDGSAHHQHSSISK